MHKHGRVPDYFAFIKIYERDGKKANEFGTNMRGASLEYEEVKTNRKIDGVEYGWAVAITASLAIIVAAPLAVTVAASLAVAVAASEVIARN